MGDFLIVQDCPYLPSVSVVLGVDPRTSLMLGNPHVLIFQFLKHLPQLTGLGADTGSCCLLSAYCVRP
jgi:hypothetical protein